MKKVVMGLFCILLGTPAFANISSGHKTKHPTAFLSLDMWCGSPSGTDRDRFPFLAAIHTYRTRTGAIAKTATIYKKGRAIMREYVVQTNHGKQFSYEGSGDTFSLTFGTNKIQNVSRANLKAYVRDEDGAKLIANSSIPCYKVPKS